MASKAAGSASARKTALPERGTERGTTGTVSVKNWHDGKVPAAEATIGLPKSEPMFILRLGSVRNELGYALSELEQSLATLGVVESTRYTDSRNAPVAGSSTAVQQPTVFNSLSFLCSEAQSVLRRFTDFVHGEDQDSNEDHCCEDEEGAEKRTAIAIERSLFGRRLAGIANETTGYFSSTMYLIDRLDESLLSRPEALTAEPKDAKEEDAIKPESVIEVLENVEHQARVLTQRISALNDSIVSNF